MEKDDHTREDVFTEAAEVLGGDALAVSWFDREIRSLGDRTPHLLMDTPDGRRALYETLQRIEFGVY